jgi:hypothetical protein
MMIRMLLLALLPSVAMGDELVENDNVGVDPAPGVTIKTIQLDNRLGDVTVVGHDAPGVALSVRKTAPDEEILDRLKVNLVPDPSGTVTISSAMLVGTEMEPIAEGSARIDIRVEVPRGARVEVKTWNGKMDVRGTQAGAALAGHDSDITVADVKGLVTTQATRGRQQLSGVLGSIDADDTFGELALDDIAGDTLAARVHEGTITATRIRATNVRIVTTFGDIHFRGEVLVGAHVELKSYKGNVEVQAGGNYQVDAFSRDGTIDVPVGLADASRDASGHLIGWYGERKGQAILVASSALGTVRFLVVNP